MRTLIFSLLLLALSETALAQPPTAGKFDLATPTSGTLTATWQDFGPNASFRVVTLSWKCTTGGAVLAALPVLDGEIVKVSTNPTDAPTDDYDVTLADADGLDLLCGLGSNRDTTTTEAFCPMVGNGTGVYGVTSPGGVRPVVMAGESTLTITTAGSEKSGVIRLTLLRRH